MGVAMAVAIADLPGHLNGNLDGDALADFPGDLLGDLVAFLNRHALALLIVSIAVALLLVSDVARRLVDGLIDGVAGLLVLGLVFCVVDGVTLGLVLEAGTMATGGLRSSGREADNGEDDKDCRIHVAVEMSNG